MTGVDTEASGSGISAAETGCGLTPWEQVYFSVEFDAWGVDPPPAAFETFSTDAQPVVCVLTEARPRQLPGFAQ